MEIDRHVQRLGTLEDRPELPFIMETAVGQAMDHRALEAKLRHRALQLVGGGLRVGCRQRGEAGKADRMRAHRRRQPVVGLPRQAHRGLRIGHLLHRRRGVRDHLQVDAGLVHFLDAHARQGLPAAAPAAARGWHRADRRSAPTSGSWKCSSSAMTNGLAGMVVPPSCWEFVIASEAKQSPEVYARHVREPASLHLDDASHDVPSWPGLTLP